MRIDAGLHNSSLFIIKTVTNTSPFRKVDVVETYLPSRPHLSRLFEGRHRVRLEYSRLVYHADSIAAAVRTRVYIHQFVLENIFGAAPWEFLFCCGIVIFFDLWGEGAGCWLPRLELLIGGGWNVAGQFARGVVGDLNLLLLEAIFHRAPLDDREHVLASESVKMLVINCRTQWNLHTAI